MEDLDRINAALDSRYRIERELGEGGMATVYVAHDERHDRRVALKVLKPELAAVVGAERFLSEIRTTAGLQHPHILQLHDSGEADGLLYFVMPYVEGETLRDRVDREKQLPVEEAVGLARAIAAALQAAHEQGVVHRDIKPANILLSHGEPLVADFGIALAVQEAGGGRLTETGLSVGTPFYMSPEQATGDRDPDARSDIYSLGTVLYEMLVGEPPFQGTTAQSVLGKILTAEPSPPTEYRKSVPPHVEAVVMKSLERLPADRFASAADLGDALGNPAFRHGTGAHADVHPADDGTVGGLRRKVYALAVALALTGAALVWSLLVGTGGGSTSGQVFEFYVQGDSTHTVSSGIPGSVALDPDGTAIAYVAGLEGGGRQIFVRALDDRTARAVPGTEDAHDVFFSPDGAWLGFTTMSNELFKIRLTGGGRVPLTTLSAGMMNAVWGEDDRIYYGVTGEPGLMMIPAMGGTPEELIPQSASLLGVIDPSMLPGGDVVIYTGLTPSEGPTIQAYRVSTGEVHVLGPGITPIYADGHLVYGVPDGTLLAQRFDPSTLELTDEPVQVAAGVGGWLGLSRNMAAAPGGMLAYVGGEGGGSSLLINRAPVTTELRAGNAMSAPRASPDGDRIAYVEQNDQADLYIYSLSQGTNRLVHSAPFHSGGGWSPDGATLAAAFAADLGSGAIFLIPAGGNGEPRLFRELPVPSVLAPEFTPDGQWLIWAEIPSDGGGKAIVAGRVDEPRGEIVRLVDDGALNSQPTPSPDGRWVAYTSERTGRSDVYVTRFPEGGPGVPISTAGGANPVWRSSDTLYYSDGSTLLAAAVSFERGIGVASRSPVQYWPFVTSNLEPRGYDLLPDGALITTLASGGGTRVVVRTNLFPSR